MNTTKIIRYTAALILATAMVAIAELLGNHEIIFPEIAALVVGICVKEQQPWQVSSTQFVGLMTLSAIIGICIASIIPGLLLLKLGIGFFFIAVYLVLFRTTLVPMISACILPILMGDTSWIYPISVFLLTFAIILTKKCLIIAGCCKHHEYNPPDYNFKENISLWAKRLIIVLLFAWLPILNEKYYFIAPPLLVMFVEFSNPDAPLRKIPLKVFFVMFLSSALGAYGKLLLYLHFGLPLTICAVFVMGGLFLLYETTGAVFPPAGACALLPLLLKTKGLVLYPFMVAAGTAAFIAFAYLFFPPEKHSFHSFLCFLKKRYITAK